MAFLPHDVQEQLQKTISAAFEQAWDVLGPRAEYPTQVEELVLHASCNAVASAARRKYAIISQAAQLRNECVSRLQRLPPELRHTIWELLPYPDRFLATHVCAGWRAEMHALPRLWTDLQFFTSDARPGNTPAPDTVPHLLALSNNLPLDITVEEADDDCSSQVLISIAQALTLHAPRIVRLCVRSPRPHASRDLLGEFDALPALREFIAERPTMVEQGPPVVCPFWPLGVDLPVLEHLRLDLGTTWPEDDRRIPSLRVLQLTPRAYPTRELQAALLGCPQLASLRVDLRAPDNPFRTSDSKIRNDKLPKSLHSVTVVSVCRRNEYWAIFSFWSKTLRERTLEFDDCDGEPLCRGVIFRELACNNTAVNSVDIRLRYSPGQKTLSMRAVTDDGRIRSVSSNRCDDPTPEIKGFMEWLASSRRGFEVKATVDASLRECIHALPSTFAEVGLNPEYVELPSDPDV